MANKIVTILDLDDRGFKGALGRIKADVAAADTSFGKLKAGAKGMATEFRKSNEAQAAVVGAIGVAAYKAIQLGSDLEESINAVRVSYGDAADEVLALGDNSAKAFGLSKTELNALAVQFSSFAKTVAQTEGRSVADVLGEMTTRVADFASVMNLDLNEATQVFMSTMAGETEPIRRFGKDVSAAAVELYALENGLVGSKSEMTEAIKVQARYGLLMEQTRDTAGDFANTSDSVANKQRIVAAEFKDTAAEVGTSLLPMMQGLLTSMQSLNTVIDSLQLDKALDLSWAADAGTQIGRFLNFMATGSKKASENFKIAEILRDAEQAAADFDQTTLKQMRTFEDVQGWAKRYGAEILKLEDAETFANLVALEWYETNKDLSDALRDKRTAVDEAGASVSGYDEQLTILAATEKAAADEAAKMNQRMRESRERANEASRAIQALDTDWENLKRELSDKQAFIDVQRAFDDLGTTAAAALQQGEDATLDQQEALIKLKGEVGRYAEEVLNLPDASITVIQALIDQGKINEAEAQLAWLSRGRDIPLTPKVKGPTPGGFSYFAEGTRSAPRGLAVVGEEGPELVEFRGGERVHTAAETRRMASSGTPIGGGGISITVNAGMGADGAQIGRQIVDALKSYKRSGGNVSI